METSHFSGPAGTPEYRIRRGVLASVVLAICLAVYVATLAPGTVFGDPSEYQFIPAVWGIAHPPGYAFYTLLAGVWQRVVAIGSVAYRTNLLAACAGAWTASRVTLMALAVMEGRSDNLPSKGASPYAEDRSRGKSEDGAQPRSWLHGLCAVLAGLAVGFGVDLWQQSIHANSHIVSVALTATHLWLLVTWWADGGRDGVGGPRERGLDWRLYLLAFLVGVGVTHHPITLFGLPAYLFFILLCRPKIIFQWKTVLLGVLCGFSGLLPWLYFPLRSPNVPFGPTDMATWDGFLRHATAQGLRVNLFYFGLIDQPDRLQVFVSLAALQYGWILLALVLLGLVWLLVESPRLGLLWVGFLAGHLIFTMNSVQDVMAYLLHAFVAMGLPLGLGVLAVAKAVWNSRSLGRLAYCGRRRAASGGTGSSLRSGSDVHMHATRDENPTRRRAQSLGKAFGPGLRRIEGWFRGGRLSMAAVVPALALVLVGARTIRTLPRISLHGWDDADAFVAALHARFDGRGEGATFVSDWEHLTPYYYYTLVDELEFAEEDLRHIYVTGVTPWVDSVFGSLAQGPVYLSNYRRDVRELGFRLRPDGNLWQVLEPASPETASAETASMAPVSPQVTLDDVWVDERLQLVGYDLPTTEVAQGGHVPVTLYARVAVAEGEIVMPMARLGDIEQRWTTDSRRLTPDWRPGEIIVEAYEVAIPYGLAPGDTPLALSFVQMTGQSRVLPFDDGTEALDLGMVRVVAAPVAAREARVVANGLANIGNEVALTAARASAGLSLRAGIWEEPLTVTAGEPLHLRLTWQVLARPSTSYTIFIHLIDAQGQVHFGHDYTPLGGAFPSYLWFPKWLEGQSVVDPYTLVLPEDLPAGSYWLEVGMYEMGSIRRIPQFSADGTMTGDRLILGPVQVVP